MWLIGDEFLWSIFGTFQEINEKARAQTECDSVKPYLYEFYNVFPFHQLASEGVNSVMSRVVDALMDAVST